MRLWLTVILCVFLVDIWPVVADDFRIHTDVIGDAVIRRTDEGADGPVDPDNHRLPDLIQITIGTWRPFDPKSDLYTGEWDEQANKPFLRVDVVIDGLVNPPGFLGFENTFDPFFFGPNPVFGFVSMDADEEENTGGELETPEYRYLGNGVRFGGIPDDRSEIRDRFALSRDDFDGDCDSGREVEFSGEEFHIALLGREYETHRVVVGDNDGIFEAGETWDVDGLWLHRAHGYEMFSFACGSQQGVYDPTSTLRWSHNNSTDQTTIKLVFPLTNKASAAMRGDDSTESNDCSPFNQNSIEEALHDLVEGGNFWEDRSKACKRIIVEWADEDEEDFLRPRQWRDITALLSTSYTAQQQNRHFVWTDIFPDARVGNVNGDSNVDINDYADIHDFVENNDGGSKDADGKVNGEVMIPQFAFNFSVFDVDYDGVVGLLDAGTVIRPGDLDNDDDLDLDDWDLFVVCLQGPGVEVAGSCLPADFDFDGDVDLEDVSFFTRAFTGKNN